VFGTVGGLLAVGWLLFFLIGLARDDARQQAAAKQLRHWAQLVLMLWFNIEIWGRVVYTLWTWSS
jgi:hypothetical protein